MLRFSFELSLMQCHRRLEIYRVKNIGSVFGLSGVAFRLAPPYDGLLAIFRRRHIRPDGK